MKAKKMKGLRKKAETVYGAILLTMIPFKAFSSFSCAPMDILTLFCLFVLSFILFILDKKLTNRKAKISHSVWCAIWGTMLIVYLSIL